MAGSRHELPGDDGIAASDRGSRIARSGRFPSIGGTCVGVAGYAVAALLVVAVTVGLAAMNPYFPMGRFPIVLALPIAISAYAFGLGPGLLAYALALTSFLVFFVTPENSLWPPEDAIDAWASLTAYLIGGSLLLVGSLRVRKAIDNVERLAHSLYESNDELHRLNRTLKALSDSTHAMLRAKEESGYLEEVCGIVVEDCGHAMVWIGYAEDDEAKTVRPVACAGFEEGYLETLNVSWADTERGRGPTGTAVRTGKPSVCKNMLTDPEFEPWRAEALKRGYASSIVLPLMAEGKAFGAITIYSRAPDPFTEDEAALLSELASDLAYGIEAIRLREEHASAEESLRRHAELMAAVTDNTEAHLVYLDRDFNFIWVNPAYAKACGRAHQEFVGHNHFEFYPHEENQAIFEKVRDTGVPFSVKEKPFVFPDHPEWGITYWDWTLTPIVDNQGEVCSLVFSLMDVTHDMLARQEIERLGTEAERRAAELESFFASMGDGAALFNPDGKVALANEAARAILGAPPDAPLEEWTNDYRLYSLDGEQLPIEQYASRRALRGETIAGSRYRLVTAWTQRVISISASPVLGVDGSIVGAVMVFGDVAEQVEFERRKEELYRREHHIAEMLQQALVPSEIPSRVYGCRIAARYQSALAEAEVGGDFYDIFDLDDGKLGVLIGDVAGKGLLAAMRVSAGRYAVRSYILLDRSPSRVMALANNALSRDEAPGFTGMVTAFLAVIDTKTSVITYANAGHEPPVICRANGEIEELNVGGPALGVMGGLADYKEGVAGLGPGDTLVMVTDGITEARKGGVLWGKEGMIAFLSRASLRSPDEFADGLLEAAKQHAGGGLHDDAAIIVLQVGDVPAAD